ncbi:MAG TPA: ATPase, T2SS/T4P/T4SS family [Kofleriaceae bacterium]|nr:ATPase, T2SS/T4P/T4SS family [Kofleriaceae bacterium]
MFSITVTEKGGEQRRLDFDKPEITIGRVQGNDVILPKGNVSKRHARIVLKDGKFIIVDLKSTNGTYVNGRKITSPLVVKETDKIYIGDFILGVEEMGGAQSGRVADPAGGRMDGGPGPLPAMGHEMGGPGMGEPVPMRMPADPTGPSGPPRQHMPHGAPQGPGMAGPGMPGMSGEPPMPGPHGPHAPPPLASPPMGQGMGAGAPMGGAMGMPASSPAGPMPPPLSPVGSTRPVPRTAPPRSGPGVGAPATGGPGSPMARPAGPAGGALPRSPGPSAASAPPSAQGRPRLVGAGAQSPGPGAAPVRAHRPQSVVFAPRRPSVIEPLDSKVVKMLELQASVLDRLVPKLELNEIPLDKLGEEELWQKAESAIVDMVETMDSSGELPKFIDQDQLIKDTLNEALGLGPLEDLLADEKVEEIVVDRRDRILVSRGGVLNMASTAFSSDDSFRRVVERLVAPTGQTISDTHPLVDVRLRDGSRLAAAIPPVSVRGACLTLRKPKKSSGHSLADLITSGALSAEMADFLTTCIQARRNIVVCGAPGSGKSSLLAALATASPEGERIVSVEEVAEMSLAREDWIALEAKPSEGNGASQVDLGALLRGALRMRPDRLVVGDVRGSEALELVQAMASAADGTVAVVSGEGARGALGRLTSMARLGAPGASQQALRELVACAVDVVVHVARYADGIYRVASIEEVIGVSEDGFHAQELFAFRGSAEDGGFSAAGVIPAFYAELEARGIPADTAIFRS